MSFSAGTGYIDLTVGATATLKTGAAAAGEEAGLAAGGKLKSGLFNTVKGLAGPIIGIMALDKLFEFVKGGAADWGVLQAAVRQTNAVLTSTGGAAGISSDGISQLTETLSKKTATDQAVIRSGENMLLTFTNVKNGVGAGNDIFNQATGTILDMSKALGQDTKNSAIQLGKALNDPIKGVTALQRVGVTFTDQQKQQIKTMVASNDTMGAQKIILAELNKEFGGSAAAAATGGAKLSLTMKDLAMNLYGLFAPIKGVGISFSTWLVTPIADGIAKLVPIEQKWVADWKSTFNQAKAAAQDPLVDFPKQSNPLEQLASLIGVVLSNIKEQLDRGKELFDIFIAAMRGDRVIEFSSALGNVGQAAGVLGSAVHDAYMKFKPFIDQFGPVAAKAASISGAFLILGSVLPIVVGWVSKLSVVVTILGKAMGVLAKNPLLITLSLLVGAFYALYEVSPKFREFISGLIDQFGKLSDRVLPQIEKAFNDLVTALTPVLEQLGPAIKALFDALMPIVSGLLSGLANALSVVMPIIVSFIQIVGDGISAIVGFFQGGGAQSAGGGFVAWIQNAWGIIKGVFDTAVGWISGIVKTIGDWLSYMFSPLEPLIPKVQLLLQQIGDRFNDLWNNILSPFFSWLGPIIGDVFNFIINTIGNAFSIIAPILQTIGAIFGDVFSGIWDIIKIVFGLITDIIRGAMQIISGVIGLFLDIITGNWSGVWGDIVSIFSGIWTIIGGILSAAWNIIVTIFTTAISVVWDIIRGLWNTVVAIFTAGVNQAWNALTTAWRVINDFFGGIPGKIMGALGDFGNLLVHAGQAILGGLLDGLKAAWKGITDFVGGIGQWISDHKGPISYDRTLLIPHGKAIMQSLLGGLKSESGAIEDWLSSFTDNLAVGANIGVTSSVAGAGLLGAGGSGSGTTYNVYEANDPNSTAMAINRIQTNDARVA